MVNLFYCSVAPFLDVQFIEGGGGSWGGGVGSWGGGVEGGCGSWGGGPPQLIEGYQIPDISPGFIWNILVSNKKPHLFSHKLLALDGAPKVGTVAPLDPKVAEITATSIDAIAVERQTEFFSLKFFRFLGILLCVFCIFHTRWLCWTITKSCFEFVLVYFLRKLSCWHVFMVAVARVQKSSWGSLMTSLFLNIFPVS